MTKKQAMKWVEALRSGKYTQGTEKLRKILTTGQVTHCCLGVLCEINTIDENVISNFKCIEGSDLQSFLNIRSSRGVAFEPNGLPQPFEIRKGNKKVMVNHLADANDKGVSFKNIATWIEKNYRKL